MNNATEDIGHIPVGSLSILKAPVLHTEILMINNVMLNTDDKELSISINVTHDPKELVLASSLLLINIPLLLIIIGRKNLRERKSHQLFINIAIVHILSGVSIIASNFTTIENVLFFVIVNNGLLMEVFGMLIVLSCERVMSIKYSFKYADVQRRHIISLLTCTWIPPIAYVVIAIMFGFSQRASFFVSTVLILSATVTLGTTNLIIYRIAKLHDRFLKENAIVSTKKVTNTKTLKASYICFAIVASFVILWAPYCIHNIAWLSRLYVVIEDGYIFSQVVDYIAYLHGIVDPLFFIWLSRATKKEIAKILNVFRITLSKKDLLSSTQENSAQASR